MMKPVYVIVAATHPGLHWTSESDVYSVSVPMWPDRAELISGTAAEATSLSNSSPWLLQLSDSLTDVLELTESAMEDGSAEDTAALRVVAHRVLPLPRG